MEGSYALIVMQNNNEQNKTETSAMQTFPSTYRYKIGMRNQLETKGKHHSHTLLH